jgi:hypothetical protein
MKGGTKVKTAVRLRPLVNREERNAKNKAGFDSNLQVLSRSDEIKIVDVTDGNKRPELTFKFDRTFNNSS